MLFPKLKFFIRLVFNELFFRISPALFSYSVFRLNSFLSKKRGVLQIFNLQNLIGSSIERRDFASKAPLVWLPIISILGNQFFVQLSCHSINGMFFRHRNSVNWGCFTL